MTRVMKNSGIEWIGEIPEDWEKVRFGKLIKVLTDYAANGSFADLAKNVSYIDEIDFARLIRLTDLRKNLKNKGVYISESSYKFLGKSSLFGGEILVANVGANAGFVCEMPFVNYKASLAPNMMLIKYYKNKCHQHYMYLLLKSDAIQNQLQLKANNTCAQPKLNKDDVRSVISVIPPLKEQTRIADYLDRKCNKIDETIEMEKQVIEKLKAYKQSVITEAVTKGLNPNVPMKDSGIDWAWKVPEHWEVIKYKYILKRVKNSLRVGPFGSQLKGDDFTEEGYKVFNQRAVLDNEFYKGDTFINEKKYDDLLAFKIEPLDVLITTRGTIGKIAIVPENVEEGIIHPCIIKTTLDLKKIDLFYLGYIFNETDVTLEQFVLSSNATTIPVIYSEPLKNVILPHPPLQEQIHIATYLDNKCAKIDKAITQKESLIEKLTRYKKSLIYECVTGKREVYHV